jgi:transcriptional regulator GlxA family with amidase domain
VAGQTRNDPLAARPGVQAALSDYPIGRNQLFVVDGQIWTGAGMSAGIDLALAVVENDLGGDLAAESPANW